MITHVLDTSALLAHYLQEPGAADVNNILAGGPEQAGISLISLVELRGRLPEVATNEAEADRAFHLYTEKLTTILPFTRETADAASAKQHEAVLVHRDPHMAAIPSKLVRQLVLPPKR